MEKIAQARTIVTAEAYGGRYCYTPAIARTPDGRLVATYDDGEQGFVLLSSDGGLTWQRAHVFPFRHARPFTCGGSLYVIGHDGDVQIVRSADGGLTWSKPSRLTQGQSWHASAGSLVKADGYIHLVMERHMRPGQIEGWNVADLAPVLLSAREGADLLDPSAWTFSPAPDFTQALSDVGVSGCGIPFYPSDPLGAGKIAGLPDNAPMGWLEGNAVSVSDPGHIWYDGGKSIFVFLRAHTSGTGYACLVRMVREEPGRYRAEIPSAPSGEKMMYLPLPGGHLKFFIEYDAPSGLYWLVSNQASNSMLRPELLNKTGIFGLPNNERHRLQLHFSKNGVDWCPAGMLNYGDDESLSCCYPCAVTYGQDLLVVARCSDGKAENAQRTNSIKLYTVRNFRDLAY